MSKKTTTTKSPPRQQPVAPPAPLLTLITAAEITSTSTKWLRQQIKAGRLLHHRLGAAIRISPEDLDQVLTSLRH